MADTQTKYPETVSQDVKDFIDHYMHHSNASSAHNDHAADDAYFASLFTSTGSYTFCGRSATGSQQIIALRQELFKEIPHRAHWIREAFTFGGNELEMMVFGSVGYVGHEGSKHATDWAARYSLARTGESVKFKSVQIMTDPMQPDE